MKKNNPKLLVDSSSPEERRGFLKKLGAFAAGVTALGGFTSLRAKNTFSGKELSAVAAPEAYIGSITMFGGNFAIRNWAFCNGQIEAISQNQALFSILGCTFGGDCRTSFGLPDLRGRVPTNAGTGPGLPTYSLGQRIGTTTHTMTALEMPAHTHTGTITTPTTYLGTIKAKTGPGGATADPTDATLRNSGADIYTSSAENATMASGGVAVTPEAIAPNNYGSIVTNSSGSSQSFSLMQPTLAVHFLICLFGIFPPRN